MPNTPAPINAKISALTFTPSFAIFLLPDDARPSMHTKRNLSTHRRKCVIAILTS